MKRPFTKPATTYQQQVQLLLSRGMTITDEGMAAFYLEHLNYYRLGAYWLPDEADHQTHLFRAGATFDNVLRRYVFDRELRLLLLDAIERVEVSVRAKLAYELAHQHGAHAHLDGTLAINLQKWHKDSASLHEAVKRSDETFIKHHRKTYTEALPPVWAICEVMSLGLLSKWYDNLKPMPTRQAIAHAYGIDQGVLASWLRHLTLVRNVCAHHARLWNREFVVTPQPPKSKPLPLAGGFVASRRLYNTLLLLLYWMDVVAPAHHWRSRLKALLLSHADYLPAMGFPKGWETPAIWQEVAV
jgi:abortive infection bacteriophage resistance protein